MSQSSVAKELPENQEVVSKSLTEQPQRSRGNGTIQTERRAEKASPASEISEGTVAQSHVTAHDTPESSERLTTPLPLLEQLWISSHDDDEIDDDSDNMPPLAHELSLHRINDTLNLDDGPWSDHPKNQAFLAYLINIDPAVKDTLRDINKLYNNIANHLLNSYYFRIIKEYKQSIKSYTACRKKYGRKDTTDEAQNSALVQTARESLDALRACLLNMNFELFAETEQGREFASLEEQARTIYQATTNELREDKGRREKLYDNFLANRNAFLLHWNIPEDNTEQGEYTEQQLHTLDRMKKSLQKYIAISTQEVKKCYEQSLKDEALLNILIQWLPPQDQQESAASSSSDDLQDLKQLMKDVKLLHKNMREDLSNHPEFQQEYNAKCQEYIRLVDHLKKTAISKRDHDHSDDATGAQEQALSPDTLEQSQHAQDISTIASEALFQLMDIRDMLLERNFACFAETEQGQEIARLEEQARELYWAVADELREKGDQEHPYYADFLAHRNAFLCRWHRSQGEKGREQYTEQEQQAIDEMKKSLQHTLEWYQQEVKRSYEHFLDNDELHERLIRTLSTYLHPQIKNVLRSNGLNIKKQFEDLSYLHKSICDEWHDHPDFQHQHSAFQETYYKIYFEYNNIIYQFKISETLENTLRLMIATTRIRNFLLKKISAISFLKAGAEREMASHEVHDLDVDQRQTTQSQAPANHQQQDQEASALENRFEAFLKQEEGKQFRRWLEEINMYLRHNKYLQYASAREMGKLENKKKKIFGDNGIFLANNQYLKERQMKELRDQLLVMKIKIEERIYVLFLHHEAGQATQQLEEKYRAFAATINFLFDNTPLDLQNALRVPAKEYNCTKVELVKQLAHPARSESNVKRCVEKLNRSLAEQIIFMKKKIWSQFRAIWHENGIKKKIMDSGEDKQGKLESYIENILNLSDKITDELYQNDVFREALKIQFAYNTQTINDELEDDEDQNLYDAKSVFDQLILLHNCMATDCSKG